MNVPKIRLYVEQPLGAGQTVPVTPDQAHYLFSVMRQGPGAEIALFNGQAGEWRAEIIEAGKRSGKLRCLGQSRPLQMPPDLWLLFAPLKKARTDFIVEKATELGVARICPVQSDFTNAERIRQDRLQAHAIEAAEQCGGTYVPSLEPLQKLSAVLDNWGPTRRLMFCDETLAEKAATSANHLAGLAGGPWAILIGPEGGFSERERARLAALPFAHATRLGPRILRADTAAVAALTLWQSTLGDWA